MKLLLTLRDAVGMLPLYIIPGKDEAFIFGWPSRAVGALIALKREQFSLT
jgi:hypothetical protein